MADESKALLRQQLQEYIRIHYNPEDSVETCTCILPDAAAFSDLSCSSPADTAPFEFPFAEYAPPPPAFSRPETADRDSLFESVSCADAAPERKTASRPDFTAKPAPATHTAGRFAASSVFGKAVDYELDESFGEAVRRLIGEKALSKGDFYIRANVNSAWLSNVVKNNVTPKKEQALACCIGLRLSLPESYSLLEKAGYTFSGSSLRDVIVKFFIETGRYDIDELNEELFSYDLVPLGQSMK